jgi:hypothetical protein
MYQPEGTSWSTHDWAPFRSYFPIRYFINDFELSITFDLDSDPLSRVVTGLPTVGLCPGQYGRDVAPEMVLESPYCPFRADIRQLGTMFKSIFGVCPQLLLLVCLLHSNFISISARFRHYLSNCSMQCVLMILCLDLWLPNSSSVYGVCIFLKRRWWLRSPTDRRTQKDGSYSDRI